MENVLLGKVSCSCELCGNHDFMLVTNVNSVNVTTVCVYNTMKAFLLVYKHIMQYVKLSPYRIFPVYGIQHSYVIFINR